MRDYRYRPSERPKQTFLSRALEGFSRLIEKILSSLKSPKGNRIRMQKIKPQRIKPPERLPRPRKIQPKVLGRDGKIKSYKGSPFRKLNRFR
jgi:hypothetical protein